MIQPHGSETLKPLYVQDDTKRNALINEAKRLPSVLISSGAAASAVMLGAGYFTPLSGYMNVADAVRVAEEMRTTEGLFWPVPVMNIVSADQITRDITPSKRIALLDPNTEGNPPIAIMEVAAVETLTQAQQQTIAEKVFRTTDKAHPGVANFLSQGDRVLSGPIQVLNYSYFRTDFPETFRTAGEIRDEIASRGWNKVVAFQTRNPMHRAHEELCKIAQKEVGADGVLIHMLLGKLKPGDIPAPVRDASIRKMVELYFPENTVMITGYGFDMLYAGPREAVLHAIFRQNSGASHLIVGRDHAGVGAYYGPFDAQTIFDEIPSDALEIEIFRGDHTVWCNKCKAIVMMRDCPHESSDYLMLSGTKVRETLASGKPLPPEFSRPEVAKILMKYYQAEAAKG